MKIELNTEVWPQLATILLQEKNGTLTINQGDKIFEDTCEIKILSDRNKKLDDQSASSLLYDQSSRGKWCQASYTNDENLDTTALDGFYIEGLAKLKAKNENKGKGSGLK